MKNKQLMVVKYTSDADAELLKTRLSMCAIPHVAFRECEFIDGGALWKFYIDRGKQTWNSVMEEVNRVRPVLFRYVNNHYIENGTLCSDCGIIKV